MSIKRKMNYCYLFCTLFLVVACQLDSEQVNKSNTGLFTKIDSLVVENDFNGVILITRDSLSVYNKAFGYSDVENEVPMKLTDQFVIGSISKQMTAVLILREVEKGKIELHDKIGKYLDTITQRWSDEITIHHLLTHTHGIVDVNQSLQFIPGSEFLYSQLGYELLAMILEQVTTKSFQILSTELFSEYDLKNTFHPDNKEYTNLVKGYEENEKGSFDYSLTSLSNYVPAGSFISNAYDLSLWNRLLHSGQLVSAKTLKLMKTKYATRIHPIFDTVEYGYGLLFKEGEENSKIGALGYAPGFVSACYFFPQNNCSVIILGNRAKDLDDFKKVFRIHVDILKEI
jgi:D-alanyl-D-alanine carboxypeptidase